VINNSLAAAEPTSPLLRTRAAAEISQIDTVRNDYADRVAVVPLLPVEPVGIPALTQLASARARGSVTR
jgi:arsenite-transporting ATPase